MMDRIAGELGVDPVEVRRKNFPRPAEFPYSTATGLRYDSGNDQASFDKVLKLVAYRKAQARAKAAAETAAISWHRFFHLIATPRHLVLAVIDEV
jgi:carbon-monoxide dehydrogenase large subunit